MTRQDVIEAILEAIDYFDFHAVEGLADKMGEVLDTFVTMESRAGAILGAKGGKIGGKAKTEAKTLANRANSNLPPKEGKQARGRPRKAKPD